MGNCFNGAIAPAFGANQNPNTCGCSGGPSALISNGVGCMVIFAAMAGVVLAFAGKGNK